MLTMRISCPRFLVLRGEHAGALVPREKSKEGNNHVLSLLPLSLGGKNLTWDQL